MNYSKKKQNNIAISAYKSVFMILWIEFYTRHTYMTYVYNTCKYSVYKYHSDWSYKSGFLFCIMIFCISQIFYNKHVLFL